MRDPLSILYDLALRIAEFEAGSSPSDRTLNPLKVSSEDIRRWIERRDPRATTRWDELGREEYARTFTAARTAGADVVDDLYFAFYDTIATGGTEADFEKRVLPILIQKGWLADQPGVDLAKRVRLIYDTNLRLARSSGKWTRYWRTRAAFPYLRGVTGRDDRVRRPPKSSSDHTAFEGIILPIEHPFWTRWFPPYGFRCRCNVIQMTRSQLARSGRSITSENELFAREERLGDPVFASPALGLERQLDEMVASSNSGDVTPGRPLVDPVHTRARGASIWNAISVEEAAKGLDEILARLFGEGAK